MPHSNNYDVVEAHISFSKFFSHKGWHVGYTQTVALFYPEQYLRCILLKEDLTDQSHSYLSETTLPLRWKGLQGFLFCLIMWVKSLEWFRGAHCKTSITGSAGGTRILSCQLLEFTARLCWQFESSKNHISQIVARISLHCVNTSLSLQILIALGHFLHLLIPSKGIQK